MSARTLAIWGIALALVLTSVSSVAPCQPDPSLDQILDKLKPNPSLPDGPLSAPPQREEPAKSGPLSAPPQREEPAAKPGPLSAPPQRAEPAPTNEGQGGLVETVAPEPPGIAQTVILQLPPVPPPEVMRSPWEMPLGFAGWSRIFPRDAQTEANAIPVPDRWRIGFPAWDRYGKGHPWVDDYPYMQGNWWDPFNQNVLKGDYPIYGQHLFLDITASTAMLFEGRQTPVATTPFESTSNSGSRDFFGSPNQYFYTQNFFLSFDLFHGDAAFKPVDWRVRLTPAFNINYLAVDELAVVSPDVSKGVTRGRTFMALQEWFAEVKLCDVGPDYDFVSIRAGSQPFVSDFRGFIFSDVNRGVRLFGNAFSNRDQYNLVYFNQLEKDTNSLLNTFRDRHQQVVIANYYRQDFIFPGYTAQWSFLYNHDSPTFKFDNNGFLVRPDPVGVFQPHTIDVVYLGWSGDGHIGPLNISHAAYWALGHDSLNPLANQQQTINAQMVALELSYDQDWMRFRTSFFWASGDHDINNRRATGFDTIADNPNFAGGEFSYWQRQQVRLFGVNLIQRNSLVPDLRASKFQGQTNFVNPGLYLGNFGVDLDVTPKLRVINNVNLLWFDSVNPLQQFVYQDHINHFIGVDLSSGIEYRPFLNNNAIFKFGVAALAPGQGFRDLFDSFDHDARILFAVFAEATFTY